MLEREREKEILEREDLVLENLRGEELDLEVGGDGEAAIEGVGLLELDEQIDGERDLQIWDQKECLKCLNFQSVLKRIHNYQVFSDGNEFWKETSESEIQCMQ